MRILHLILFGGFEARLGAGPPIALPTRKARALLAYLALPPGRPRTREQVAALLWGGTGEEQARNSLRQTLFLLRRALPGFEGLRVGGETLALAPDAVDVDAVALEDAVRGGTPAGLDRAARLYRGELLEGFGLRDPAVQEWLALERERFRDLALRALAGALDEAVVAGAAERAVALALRLLAVDPLQEGVHRTLIRLHADQGRLGLARRQYRRCRDLLLRELGVGPGPETEALRAELFDGRRGGGVAASARPPAAAKVAFNRPDGLPVVAVLPFGADTPETEALADRLTGEVIAALGAWRGFAVLSRSTTSACKARGLTAPDLARALGVGYVVEGSLRRRGGDRVAADVQVVEAATGRVLTTDGIDGPFGDRRSRADADLARWAAATVGAALEQIEQRRALAVAPADRDAWSCWLQGMLRLREHGREDLAAARLLFERALALERRFARAWTGIGFSHVLAGEYHFVESQEDAFALGLEALRRALALDGADYFGHAVAGRALMRLGEFDLAQTEAEQAVTLNPASPMAHGHLGNLLAFMGAPERGIPELEYSLRLSPRGSDLCGPMWCAAARSHLNARRHEGAVAWAKQALLRIPEVEQPWSYAILASSLGHLGRRAEAERAVEACERLRPGRIAAEFQMPPTQYRNPADHLHILDGLRKAGWRD